MFPVLHNSTSVGESKARNSLRSPAMVEITLSGDGPIKAIVRIFTSLDGVDYKEESRMFFDGDSVVRSSYHVTGPWYYVDVTKLEGVGARIVIRGD